MANPFEKRATEFLREDEAFLAVVTHEPLHTFFTHPAEEERLYDRLVMIIGTPGSGKTTMARLFQYSTLHTLVRNKSLPTYTPLVNALRECQALEQAVPVVAGTRLPLESEYREFWELPYPVELRTGLMHALLQARAVLGWLRGLTAAGHTLDTISIVPREDASAAIAAIGGLNAASVQARGREMEEALYRIAAALVPPPVETLPTDSVSAYRPLDVIEAFRVVVDGKPLDLRPLVILDDAHVLHPDQLKALRRWLARRELRVARWILMRLDVLRPAEALGNDFVMEDEPGIQRSRDITEIWMQGQDDRGKQRRAFRSMAKDMADRYLAQMDVFQRKGLTSLGAILETKPETLSDGKLMELCKSLDVAQRKLSLSDARRRVLEDEVDRFLSASKLDDKGEDVRLAMIAILMHRASKRVGQPTLFGEPEPEPEDAPSASSSVADGARIHLFHRFGRPYYYAIDNLCDASSENAEQFLHFAAVLVDLAETRLIRGSSASLAASVQQREIRSRARDLIDKWQFPLHQDVRRLSTRIAERCLKRTLEPNASLGGGASAIGIPQGEFDQLAEKHQDLARVLQFGVAYNAISLVPNTRAKNRSWCLIELGGALLVHHGLTLKRGGFVESRAAELARMLVEDEFREA